MNKKSFWNWFSTVLLGVFGVIFVWSFALAVPIYSRFIYYSQVGEIAKESGYDQQTVKNAYDDVLDYLTLHKDFATGELSCSNDAKSHFADCQKLFDLNLALLVVSAVGLATLGVLAAKKVVQFKRIKKLGALTYSAIVAFAVPLVFGVVAAVDFDAAFTLFHAILFPGKTNWQFDSVADQIINILPERYFAICGAVFAGIVFAFALCVVVWEVARLKRARKNLAQKLDK